jgi:non-ribosomal peptide synthetase component E (peptide arylation enzyme)
VCAIGADTVYLTVLPISHNFPLALPGLQSVRPCSPDDETRIVDPEGRDVPVASPASVASEQVRQEHPTADHIQASADQASRRTR